MLNARWQPFAEMTDGVLTPSEKVKPRRITVNR